MAGEFNYSKDESLESLLAKVKSAKGDFNPKEQKAAEYFIDTPYELLTRPMKDITVDSDVSQATWVRFSQKIGFHGLKELKQFLGTELVKDKEPDYDTPYADIKGEDSFEEIISRVFRRNMTSLTETFEILDFKALSEAIDAIVDADQVGLFGVGASGLVAIDAQYKFSRIGLKATAVMDLHMQITQASTLAEDDVAIIFTNSGNTRDVIDIAKAAKGSGAKIIAITKFGNSRILDYADIVLNNISEPVIQRSGATASRISQLTIVDVLLTAIGNRHQEEVSEMLDRSHRILNKHDEDYLEN